MVKYYARQVDPELQEDDLFFTSNTKKGRRELHFNDDWYENDVIISGNKEFLEYYTDAYEKITQSIDNILYEYELASNPKTNGCYWNNVSEVINYYFAKENGKKYSTKEIHEWKKLLEDWSRIDDEDFELKALHLITEKEWRKVCIRGYMQREWQYLYVSENITEKDVRYIEMCYFNTGTEWRIYESEEDFENYENATSMYIEDVDELPEWLGCEEDEIEIYLFDGYTKVANYKRK